MIPAVLARHVEQGIKDFLRTTFPITTPFFSGIVERLLNETGSIFKGPYLDIQLPFQPGIGKTVYFPNLPMSFTPYLHQEQAFVRLAGPEPQSTIIATGTGSGKTECFLYPVLDYCYRHRGEPGIKAIFIYPMNALATDQAGRLATLIQNSTLKGHVNAGIYVGQREQNPTMLMTADRLISDKETLRLSPPDILLTNYKMLDYLLIRPEDRQLWQHNDPETLKFLVVDELHTFDGAQGADLGCLIRRLKGRLAIRPGHLCCVGTSATLGSNDDPTDLFSYATAIFGEQFSPEALISEARLSAGEFLGDSLISHVDIVPPGKAADLDPAQYSHYEDYITAQYQLWFSEELPTAFGDPHWRLTLGTRLKEHLFCQNLLKVLGGKIQSFSQILGRLEKVTRGLKNADPGYAKNILNSMLSLISEARIMSAVTHGDSGRTTAIRPFLNVRVQLWIRELRRMVASVGREPRLRFADDLNEEQLGTHLPLVHCRECGCMGWSGLKRKTSAAINGSLPDYYHAFFKHDPKVVYLFPEDSRFGELTLPKQEGAGEEHEKVGMHYLCPKCLHVTARANPECCSFCEHQKLILVHMPDVRIQRSNRSFSHNDCPYCGSTNSLTLLGSRAASLTSVMIVQLYSSTYNDDKKLLTFSDNVQDAAHRAGFFNGRTYRFNFRTALQRVVLAAGEHTTLAALPDLFTDHWLREMNRNRYLATFLAPNMTWLRDYEELQRQGSLPKESTLLSQINNRVSWEIVSEYGFQARIGRTLEKTSSSVAYLDPEQLDTAISRMLEPIRNEIGPLQELDEESLARFLLGFLVHLKNQGGIYLPSLDGFLTSYGTPYLLTRNIWMPNFGPFSRTPSFLTTRKGSRFDQLFSAAQSRRTWYQSWAEKCFIHVSPFIIDVYRELYDLVLKILVDQHILAEKSVKGDMIWGIRTTALHLSTNVRQLRCRQCGHNLSVAAEEEAWFDGAPCQRFYCYGTYETLKTAPDYYGKLYATGDVERIFAREHTGLLNRPERERLEEEFKADNEHRQPWYANLLSCTPTLEMGIDIGSLSSLILCSVPPAQANYLQRIGRAGRRDGNALNLAVANARPHDLYFFAEPEQMLAGHIDAPGIFLDASAVMERQFTAFCFDRWIAEDFQAIIPGKLGQVLNNLEPVEQKKFPHNLITFIETRQTDLFDHFVTLFKESGSNLSPESAANLKRFVEGDGDAQWFLRGRIMNGLHQRRRELDSLKKKIQILNGKIRKMKKEPKDRNFADQLRELQIEKSALQSLVKNLSNRNTFNFFTDEGLLPNYAFPEVGVMLNSLIYRKKSKVQEGEGSYDTWSYEYERPARSAIEELAPANTFYAEGRKVKVDQVDMSVSEMETWRFCNNCSHKELLGREEERDVCIKCGSPLWGDAGQKRLMLRMRQVFASTSDRKSRISDDADDREPTFYHKQMLVEFDDRQVLEAYKVDADFPFGFDFLAKVDFCEINFGEKTEIGEKISIAGVEMPRQGFALCRVCGKVRDNHDELHHALTCTAKDQESDRDLIDCIYLYRQFVSEAVRILLPVSIMSDSERKLQSFIAAIQLGLKKRFRGKIDHLQTTVHEEPIPDSSLKRKYLILYDTVPGGTGYLKQLMRSENELMSVLELALETLKSCTCNQEEGKDGCYRCLFAYRNSYHMPETSRNTAIELLAEILTYRENLVKTENIRDISLNTFIESELEARFLGALKLYRSAALPVILKNDLVNGKPGYFLKVGDRSYTIEPQVVLDDLAGVSITSRADFVIRPARSRDRMKPIALFLDGYTFHRDRIGKDMAQRMAIVQSGKFHTWSLTWNDVENRFKSKADFYQDFLDPAGLPAGGKYNELLDGYQLQKFKKLIRCNSFDLLIRFLENPEAERWRQFMFVVSLLQADPHRFSNEEAISQWSAAVRELLPEEIAERMLEADRPCLYGEFQTRNHNGQRTIHQSIIIEHAAVTLPGNPHGVRVSCCLDDHEENRAATDFQSCWNGYLRLYNFYQFLPYAYFITSDGVKHNTYDGLKLYEEPIAEAQSPPKSPDEQAWDDLREVTDKTFHSLLTVLQDHKWPIAEAGYELEGVDGEVIGCAELAWETLKLAFLTNEELVYQEAFMKAGWLTLPIRDVMDNPNHYMDFKKLSKGKER